MQFKWIAPHELCAFATFCFTYSFLPQSVGPLLQFVYRKRFIEVQRRAYLSLLAFVVSYLPYFLLIPCFHVNTKDLYLALFSATSSEAWA